MFNLRNTLNKPVYKKQAYSEFLSESFAKKVTTKDVLQILSFPGKKFLTRLQVFLSQKGLRLIFLSC